MTRPASSLTLGALEMAVLELLWRLGSGDVRAVHMALSKGRDNHPNTVQSALERLLKARRGGQTPAEGPARLLHP